MDILELLTVTLNFSCALTHEPEYLDQSEVVTWAEHAEIVAKGDVDIGECSVV